MPHPALTASDPWRTQRPGRPRSALHREDLDPRPGECHVCYVDRMIARSECSGELLALRWWQPLRAPRATSLARRIAEMGAECDCELLTRVYEPAPSLVDLPAGGWDRPRCDGVRPGSSQPCGRWRRRARWA